MAAAILADKTECHGAPLEAMDRDAAWIWERYHLRGERVNGATRVVCILIHLRLSGLDAPT